MGENQRKWMAARIEARRDLRGNCEASVEQFEGIFMRWNDCKNTVEILCEILWSTVKVVYTLTKKCRTKNGLRLKKRTRTGVKRKKKRIRQFAFFKICVFFPFFVRILKKIKTDCVLKKRNKNGKLPENAGKKTEISKNGNGRIRFSKFPSFFRFFLYFRFFPDFVRFSKTQSVFW